MMSRRVFLCLILLLTALFMYADSKKEYLDEDGNIVKVENIEDQSESGQSYYHKVTHYYSSDGILEKSTDYLKSETKEDCFQNKEEIFSNVDEDGTQTMVWIKRYNYVCEYIDGGKVETKQYENLDADSQTTYFLKQEEKNYNYADPSGQKINFYSKKKFNQENDTTYHYERMKMNYFKEQDLINQTVIRNYDNDQNMKDMKVIRSYQKDGVSYKDEDYNCFASQGDISKRSVKNYSKWKNDDGKWQEKTEQTNYEGESTILNKTLTAKTTQSINNLYQENIHVIREDKSGTIVQEYEDEKQVVTEPYEDGYYGNSQRVVQVVNRYDDYGKCLKTDKDEWLHLNYHNGTFKVKSKNWKELSESDDVLNEKTEALRYYDQGELEKEKEMKVYKKEAFVSHQLESWYKEGTGNSRYEKKVFDENGEITSQSTIITSGY